jgi:ribosomal protein S18 acetylase RimI-like enzyme
MITLRPIEHDGTDTAVEIFARAFQQSALYRYFEPDDEKRRAFLRLVFQHRLAYGFDTRKNILAAIDEKPAGAALWERPGPRLPPNEALTESVRRYDPAVFEKWQHFHSVLFAAFDRICAGPHWALAPIAVLPEFHRRGLARELIRAGLAETGAAGAPCMLATQDRVNTGIYERCGFSLADSVHIAEDLYCYVMLRTRPPA